MKLLKHLLTSLFISLLFALPLQAKEAFVIDDFQTEITMNKDTSIDVTETIKVTFSEQRHGIYRDIHDEGLEIELIDITNEQGEPLTHLTQKQYLTTRFRIGDANKWVNGAQTYKIRYKAFGGVTNFWTHNELYWNATGTEWKTPIKKATSIITVPETISNDDQSVQFRCFTGAFASSEENCDISRKQNKITFTTSNLKEQEGLTIVVGVPRGHIITPSTLEINTSPDEADVYTDNKKVCTTPCKLIRQTPEEKTITIKKFGYEEITETATLEPGKTTSLNFELSKTPWFKILMGAITIFFLLVMIQPIYKWFKYGKDPKISDPIIPEHKIPHNLSPAEVGTLIDERADLKDISATIINLAVRGYIKIEVLKDAIGFFFKSDDYKFIKLPTPKKDHGLSPFESKIMSYIFANNKEKKLSDLEYKFHTHLKGLKQDLYNSLIAKKYFTKSPEKVRRSSFVIATATIFVAIFLFPFEIGFFGTVWSLAILVNGILALILHRFMPKKTIAGMKAYQEIKGFEMYLKTAEKHHVKFQEQQHLFYQYLPFAMTLNVADKWSKAFKGIFKNPPEWISGLDEQFKTRDFIKGMNNMSSSITKTMASTYTPPSRTTSSRSSFSGSSFSGSSGFSSGGSSGGGFGGGGGGSW